VGFNLDGYVLRPSRSATGNSKATDETITGVDRDHILPSVMGSLGYEVLPSNPVEPYADMYRAAVLLQPTDRAAKQEYCIFAATTGSLSTIEDSSVTIYGDSSTVFPVTGTLPVDSGTYNDGTLNFYIRDAGGRDISSAVSIVLKKSGSLTSDIFVISSFDSVTGNSLISDPANILGGGFSIERGDTVVGSYYILAGVTFWWTRNDSADGVARFGWDGRIQKWLPLKGSSPVNLGMVKPNTSYLLSPPPTRFSIGDVLPYDPSTNDSYALLRIGLYPDSISIPLNVLVVSDSDAEGPWQGSWSSYDAVVGVDSGVLFLNPVFSDTKSGLGLWYNPETFIPNATGDLGQVSGLFTTSSQNHPVLSPIPNATERPFIRIGNRQYLTPVSVPDDSSLPSPASISSNEFYWSRTTGKLVVSSQDIDRCTPGSVTYELSHLGSHLYFDGVAMSTRPIPVKSPSAVLDESGNEINGNPITTPSSGDLFIQRAVCLPPPGISGVTFVPDGSGDYPNLSMPQTRPNGSGLIREVASGDGDVFFFGGDTDGGGYAYENSKIVEYDEDLPILKIKVPKNTVEVSRMERVSPPPPVSYASRIEMRRRPVLGESLYFRQCNVVPSVYSETSRIYSRFVGPYTFDGTELIRFSLNGVIYTWSSVALVAGNPGSFSASQVSSSIQSSSTPSLPVGSAGVERGRIYIEDTTDTSIEIGWNVDQYDLSGHAALGLLPGWRIVSSDHKFRWLPDNGSHVGIFRSPFNLDRSNSTPDIRAKSRIKDILLTGAIPPVPFITVYNPPLEDIPGYEEDSHFRVKVGLLNINLKNYKTKLGVGVKYDWDNSRFIWLTGGDTSATSVDVPSNSLQLSDVNVFPETVSSDAMLDASYGFFYKGTSDNSYSELSIGTDFLLTGEGQPGQTLLINVEGGVLASGGKGTFTSGSNTFTDVNIYDQTEFYNSVEEGNLLHILNGDAEGVYEITGKSSSPITTVSVFPNFPASTSTSQWKVYDTKIRDQVDPTLLADVKQVIRNHLPEEPFKIRLVTFAGTVGGPVVVNPVDALISRRITKVRFGINSGSPEATPNYLLRGEKLGTLAQTGLVLPDLSDPHVTNSSGVNAYFQIRVGANVFSIPLGNLTLNIGSVPNGTIDVNTTTGELLIATDVASDLSGSLVYYDQLFLPPSVLSAGECEVNVADGSVNVSSIDVASYSGVSAYFVEQMVTEKDKDVFTSPLNGSILFSKPLVSGQIVEANYFKADSSGDKALDQNGNPIEITEFLPLIVRLEETTRITDTQFTYNPLGKTLSSVVDPFIWVGVNLQNFAGAQTATASNGVITLISPAAATATVKINYGVLEAFGGEQAYTVSTFPVYRKPLFLLKGQNSFPLATDRTQDFGVGKVMVLGKVPFYITDSVYDSATDTTSVSVFPTPLTEVGSRAVGRDSNLSVTDFVVSVGLGGAQGFMPLLDTLTTPLLPSDRGQLQVLFMGDVRQYTRSGHILEIDGYPYIVTVSNLTSDGRNTVVEVSTPLYKYHDNTQVVRVSVRPVYNPSPFSFLGSGSFLPVEDYDLILMGSVDEFGNPIPGVVLTKDLDYSVDAGTGDINFQYPSRSPLSEGERLYFRCTRLRTVGPAISDGAVLYPLYKGKYLHVDVPSLSNRVLNSALRAEYTYSDPDSFCYSVLPLSEYLPQVEDKSSTQGLSLVSYGTSFPFAGSSDLGEQGNLGLRGDVRNLKDQDRAARTYVDFFNNVILAFEQVLEAIDGRVIGDRDGKFRFFLGKDKRYSPPGWEDSVTGDMVSRLIWRYVVEEWAPDGFNGWYETPDAVYNPVTSNEPDPTDRPGETDGETPNPDILKFFTDRQRRLIKNDMDDVILIGFGRPRGLATLFPSISVPGLFKQMWENHPYSRLFPERTKHFTRLFPGLESTSSYEGYYTSGRKVTVPGPNPGEETEQTSQTRNYPIGKVANPAIGDIKNIVEVTVSDRMPRARVWSYYPEGSSELDNALFGGVPTTVGRAAFVATPLTLGEFPIDPDTGFPDVTDLITQSNPNGSIYSLESGDVDLSTPAFVIGQILKYGKPTGVSYTLTTSDGNGVFVSDDLVGCVILLSDVSGNPLSDSDILVNGVQRLSGITTYGSGYGDTVFSGLPIPDLSIFPTGPTDTVTIGDSAQAKGIIPDYRIQFDLKVGKNTGELIDASLPTKEDVFPLPLQDLFGQKPPAPLSCVEGTVEFINTDTEPLNLPCLLGQSKDDSGDNQIPYVSGTSTELSVLGIVAANARLLFLDSVYPLPVPASLSSYPSEQQNWKSVLPDEVIGADGSILVGNYVISPPANPATLSTSSDLTPVTTSGYTPNSGVGDVRRFDLLLVEAGQSPVGITGILTVGEVTSGTVEVPRFVTATPESPTVFQPVKHTIENAVVAVNLSGTTGVKVTQSNPFVGVYVTVFDFSSISGIILDDGNNSPTGTGGYNRFLGLGGTGNTLVLRIYNPAVGTLVESIAISESPVFMGNSAWGTVTAPLGVPFTTSPPNVRSTTITVVTTAPISSVANDGNFYDVTITADAYTNSSTSAITGAAVGGANGSTTAWVDRDRLTFNERVNLANSASRGVTTATGAVGVETSLAVYEITVGAAAAGCTINSPNSVNGGLPFTFLERWDSTLFYAYTGKFVPASGLATNDERGYIKVMAWEANGNTPLSVSDISGITFSAVPSSDVNETSVILEGGGTNIDGTVAPVLASRAWIQDVTTTLGSISSVQSGDILVVDGGPSNTAAVKTGTYLVRHAVNDNNTASDGTKILDVKASTSAGYEGALDLTFPRIVSVLDVGGVSVSITVDALPSSVDSPTGNTFPATGQVYLLLKNTVASFDGAIWQIDPDSVYVGNYGGTPTIDPVTGEATFSITSFTDAAGTVISQPQFLSASQTLPRISGMEYIPFRKISADLPSNNCVGYSQSSTVSAIAGVSSVVIGNTGYDPTAAQTYTLSAANLFRDTGAKFSPNLYIYVPDGSDSTSFYPDRDTVVYPALAGANPVGVASYFDVSRVDWDTVHFNGTVSSPNTLRCFLPNDTVVLGDSLVSPTVPGFHALSGIFLEPSFPLPVGDLGQSVPHVVSSTYTVPNYTYVGFRNYEDYFSFPPATQEVLHFYVRRIRRFHESINKIVSGLESLKYCYETRKGYYSFYDTASRKFTADTSVYGYSTNLGFFNNADVNINAGDTLRVIDPVTGLVTDTAEIQKVVGPTVLLLRKPGLVESIPVGAKFEIYLSQAIIPHQQSNDQLLDLLTEKVVYTRIVDYSAGDIDGGLAPSTNEMQDPTATGASSWASLGVEEGDYIVVDPSGPLYIQPEVGIWPLGDQSVVSRVPFDDGSPAKLDDNRGFYRVASVDKNSMGVPVSGILTIDGTSRFSDGSTFGDPGAEYVVLPTISASGLTGGIEGQQDLRPTSPPIGNSYAARALADEYKSIEPFGYRIIRPNSVFSQDATELVLFMRERVLSLIQSLKTLYPMKGDYYVFQRDDHIADLGSSTDPTSGLGVLHNVAAINLIGLTPYTPYANTSGCLSILDRRFWILDFRLDALGYTDFVQDGYNQRPVLPDLIEEVLNLDDRFRDQRYAWISFRANRQDGSIQAARRAETSLDLRILKQREAISRQKAIKKS